MKKGWTTTKLTAVASLGVLMTVLQLLGGGIQAATGMIGLGGILNVLVTPSLIIICLLVVDQFGAAMVMFLVNSILILPLPLTGTPGFLLKVPILIVAGAIADVLYLLLRKNKKIASLVTGGLLYLYLGFAIVEVGRLFGMPGIEETARLLYSPLVLVAVLLAALSGLLGWFIYSRIENTAVVKRIQR